MIVLEYRPFNHRSNTIGHLRVPVNGAGAVIEFRTVDAALALRLSPLLRAAKLTLDYVLEHGPIPLTPNKAFKRVFVTWAAEQFDWPGMTAADLFRVNKVLNEQDFPPLEMLHHLLLDLKLGRHLKGQFTLTKQGKALAADPVQLFAHIIPPYLFEMDHSYYARFADRPFGKWDVWLNVINVEAENGATETKLFEVFYGKQPDSSVESWRERSAFYANVLRPLCAAGFLTEHDITGSPRADTEYFKTQLWRSVLKLDTDNMLPPRAVH